MVGLILSTIITSASDSLNPIAITQQFVLQGMVKKAKHIWYFIIAIAVTNFTGGLLAYLGLVTFISSFLEKIIDKYGQYIFTMELILGIAFLIGVSYSIQSTKMEALKKQINLQITDEKNIGNEESVTTKIKSVSPISLVVLGVVATLSELTTALPYFAFLAILFNYQLSLIQLIIILLVYNTIYSLPLIILYFVYIKAQDKFDYFYTLIKNQITKWASIVAPTVIGLIGIILVFHSISILLK